MLALMIRIPSQALWSSKNSQVISANAVKFLEDKPIKQPQKVNQGYRQLYEKGIQNLNAEFKLLGCLGIDESEYKRTFYLGQKQAKNNYALYQ